MCSRQCQLQKLRYSGTFIVVWLIVVLQHTSVCDTFRSVELFNIHQFPFCKCPFLNSLEEAWNCAVVNISSVQSHRAQAVDMGWTYATSKGAVTAMSRRMALDLSAHGIRVNSISPGYTWTAMVMLHMLLVFMLNCGSLSTLYIL